MPCRNSPAGPLANAQGPDLASLSQGICRTERSRQLQFPHFGLHALLRDAEEWPPGDDQEIQTVPNLPASDVCIFHHRYGQSVAANVQCAIVACPSVPTKDRPSRRCELISTCRFFYQR